LSPHTLLQLRHPNVLAFKDSLEVQEKGQTVLYLVTEAVRPLAMVLQELDLSGHHRHVTACWATAAGHTAPPGQ
jgi:SCY1-like protein 1